MGNPARRRPRTRSLTDTWFECSLHPLLTVLVIGCLEAAGLGGLVYWAGWRDVVHAVSVDNGVWFAVCVAGQVVAYLGYASGLRAVAGAKGGVVLPFRVSLATVSVGFGPMFSANTSGGFSVDYATFREAGLERRAAFQRVLSLSVLEYLVLAPAVAACGVLLFAGLDGSASASLTLPWLGVVPGALVGAWLSSERNTKRFGYDPRRRALRRGFAHVVAALAILRAVATGWRSCGGAFAGAALYWVGDIATFWAALRVFGVTIPLAVLVVAYGTGWALTRRSLPFGGPGVVEILLAWALTWFGVGFAAAAAGVVAYRLFNFWLALVPAAAVLPFGKQLERELDDAQAGSWRKQ
jgi:uncharacterized membrane protein YbhN (UPF0104 family)